MSAQTFKKEERLCNKSIIDNLFSTGKHFWVSQFKIYYKEVDLNTEYPVQIVISASKRSIKKAVSRNRIKRLIRESYRKNKSELYSTLLNNKKQFAIAIVYCGKDDIQYSKVEDVINRIINKLINEAASC